MKSKILIIDDETAILNALQIFLEQEGYDVTAVDKYDDYFKRTDAPLPDLIILDIILLDEDGREVAKHLKSEEKTKHIPIVMISAHPNAEETSLKAGADVFLAKPFDMDELLSTISRLIEKNPA